MVEISWKTTKYITTWGQFDEEIRSKGHQLLKELHRFPNSILVTGCQRSGTTMLSRIVCESDGMVNYWFGPDDELDAALILSGYVDHNPQGRYCFQTTYVNRKDEYFAQQNGHKIIWSLRNPYSVIHSMLYNWNDFGIDQLFSICGFPIVAGKDKWLYNVFGYRGISRLRRACWAYNGKTLQVFDLEQYFDGDSLMVVEYDELVRDKRRILPEIYRFIGLNYQSQYADRIHAKSLDRASNLSRREMKTIKALCEPIYKKAQELIFT